MNRSEDLVVAEAAAWHASSANDDMDWDGFTQWLEADPRHREIYDEVALADRRLQELAPSIAVSPLAANDEGVVFDPPTRSGGWWRWAGGAIAASLALALAVPQFMVASPQIHTTTSDSETIALADGSRITLAPYSRLEMDDGGQRIALSGGAFFDIRHDPQRQLVVEAGGVQIQDIGTKFDVQGGGNQVRVAVSEGKVKVAGEAMSKPVELGRGRKLTFDPAGGTALIEDVEPDDAGAWRDGRLTYQATPLSLVAADLSRYAGVKVEVASPLQDRNFSGTLIVKDGKAALRDLTQLMGLGISGSDGAYRIGPPER